jgi:hypothetical protein
MASDPSGTKASERRRRPRRRADPEDPSAPQAPIGDADLQATGDSANPLESASTESKDTAPAPSEDAGRFERVRQRAYELYLRRGDAPGDDVADWLEAEREIDAEGPR